MGIECTLLPNVDLRLSPFFYRELNGYGLYSSDNGATNNSNLALNNNHILNYNDEDYKGSYRVELASSVPTYIDNDGVEVLNVGEVFNDTKEYNTDGSLKTNNRGKLSDNVVLNDLNYSTTNKDVNLSLYSICNDDTIKIKSDKWMSNIQLGDDDLYVKAFFVIDNSNDFVLFYGLFSDEQMESNPISGSLIFEDGLNIEYKCSLNCYKEKGE